MKNAKENKKNNIKIKKIENFIIKNKAKSTIVFFGIMIFIIMLVIFNLPKNIAVDYEVKQFSIDDKILSVNVKISNAGFFKPSKYQLIKGSMQVSEEKCIDSLNNPVKFSTADGVINIDKISSKAKYVLYSYNVKIGNLGKHGANGEVYSNMLTFEGESVLAMPINALKENMKSVDNIKRISVQCMVPNVWDAIIPYPKKNEKDISEVMNPTWTSLYEIRRSSFTFGKFEKDEHLNGKVGYTVYLDTDAKKYYTEDAKKGIESLYKYYSNLFNYDLENFSIVLLKKDDMKQDYIISGSSTKNLVSSFDPEVARDWQLFGHRLFHSFFESEVTATKYHEPPVLNFYEGLATYYENISMKSLPENIKNRLNIFPDNEMADLFERYTYMKLKNPSNFSLTPMLEMEISTSPAKVEFLHYTQAPLMVKCLEDLAAKKTGKEDNIIHYIVKHKDDNSVTPDKIANSLLGEDGRTFTEKYIRGDEIVPLWGLNSKGGENKDVIEKLNIFEYNMYTWFYQENTLYIYDVLDTDMLSKLSQEADKEALHFADTITETNVKNMSPTVYNLLKEYMLRAKVCAVDVKDKYSREALLINKINVDKWNDFKNNYK